ncbi:MAG: hypothetical protein ACI8PZ_002534 [Myxococcota bacterium]|jgi:hypothetical protein
MTDHRALLFAALCLVACGGGGKDDLPADTGVSTTAPTAGASECAERAGEAFCFDEVAVVCADDGSVASSETCDAATTRCEQGECVPCAPAFTAVGAGTLDGGLFVELEVTERPFGERRLGMRALTVQARPGAELQLTGTAVEVLAADGSPVSFPLVLAEASTLLLLGGVDAGTASLSSTAGPDCAADDTTLDLIVGASRQLAGRSLVQFPHFEGVDAFNADDGLEVAVDPSRYVDRAGATADVYVVPHRTAAEWASDPSLTDVADGPVSITIARGSMRENVFGIWLSDLTSGPDLTTPFDVVLDFGADGQLDPGDLIDGLDGPGFEAVVPLAAVGPYTPARAEHSDSFWDTHYVYWPEQITTLGELPLVVISHGNGHDYTWYDYLGEHLASWGYIVISHRNNTEPGPVAAARTTRSNTEVFLRDLPLIASGALVGHVDRSSIVWIGHSRGGEGVVLAYDDLLEGDASQSEYGWQDIRLVSSIAPTLFEDPYEADPHEVTYHLLAGSSDGDVTGGPESPIVQYLRIFQNGTGDGLVTYVQGASHNDFNCCGFDDGSWTSGPGRQISREDAQRAAKSYYLALLERELRGREVLGEYLWRMPSLFRPMHVDVFMSNQWMSAADTAKVVIDDFQSEPDVTRSSSGEAVQIEVDNAAEGMLDDANGQLAWDGRDPFNGMTWAHSDDPERAERGLVFDWTEGGGAVSFALPGPARDLSTGGHVSLRVAQGTRHPQTASLDDLLSFSLSLVDADGVESAIDFAAYGRVPEPFARTGGGSGTGWSNEFSTVRVPVLAFTTDTPELDLTRLATLKLSFGPDHGSAVGRVGLDDVEILLP